MTSNRPSFGEFSGYFNICKADYERFAVGDWQKKVICDQHPIPRLTLKENAAAKNAVAELLLSEGYQPSNLEVDISYLWPQQMFSIELDQIDRSIRVYLSSAVKLSMDVIEKVSTLLRSQFPIWRAVIVLPRGDEADVVVYKDSIRIGDQLASSEDTFQLMKANWVAAENQSLKVQSTQIPSLNGCLPALFLNPKRSIFLLKAFAWSIDAENAPTESTVWFACVGKKRADPSPHTICTLEIDSREYTPAYSLRGFLDTDGKWNFVYPERAFGYCFYFWYRLLMPRRNLA